VQKTHAFLLILSLSLFIGCEDKKTQTQSPTQEITSEIFKDTSPPALSDTFTLTSLAGEYYTVTVSNHKVTFKESNQGIVLISFFATWCTPCLRQIPDLNTLGKRYKKDLFIAGVLVNDSMKNDPFRAFVKDNKIGFYLSYTKQNDAFANILAQTLKLPSNFSIPLTVMYVGGEYFTHY
jgi:thiol-disulfide isomerase/thioredoxin